VTHPTAPGADGERWALDVGEAWIHRASEGDLQDAIDILEEVTRWAALIGVQTWDEGTFRSEDGRGRRQLVEALGAGDLYIVRMGEDAAATVSLFERDERYWPGARPEALYLHKLAVRRRFAGRHLGGAVLRWARDQARSRGRRYLRLNCVRDEPWIRRYYEAAGFAHRGDVTVGDFDAALYETPTDRLPSQETTAKERDTSTGGLNGP
jgi:GNAT superfamily N-acetyltransferase